MSNIDLNVGIDLGASNTRVVLVKEKEHDIKFLENNMIEVEVDRTIDLEPYSDDIESALDVTVTTIGENTAFAETKRMIYGELASRISTKCKTPDSLQLKHKQLVNLGSVEIAIAKVVLESGFTENEVPTISLDLAIPPAEVKRHKDRISSLFVGEHEVIFNKLNKTVRFKVVEVDCNEESFMALISFFFDSNLKKKEVNVEKFGEGYLLGLDLGASTTDPCIAKDMNYQDYSGNTLKIGGNHARDAFIEIFLDEKGYRITQEDANRAVEEGRIREGNNWSDVSDIVKQAKKECALEIVDQLKQYFSNPKITVDMRSIRGVIVSGGGSMHSKYYDEDKQEEVITAPPMSHFIMEEYKAISPNTAIVNHSGEENNDGNNRLANIYGMIVKIRSKIYKRKLEQKQNGMKAALQQG